MDAGAHCAAFKTKDLGHTVLAVHFPFGLLKHSNNIFPFYILKGPIGHCQIFGRLFQFVHKMQLVPRRVHHRPCENVFKLADIAGPVIVLLGIQRSRRDTFNNVR